MAKAAVKKAVKAATKTEILTSIAAATDLPKKKVAEVLDALAEEIKKNLGKRGPGVFTLPGLVKIEKKHVRRSSGPKELDEPLHQAIGRSSGQARLGQGQGPRPPRPQGHGQVALSPTAQNTQPPGEIRAVAVS